MWNEPDGARRRYRLAADTAKEAEREARDLILQTTAPTSGLTVAQIWEAYRVEMGERRQAAKLAQTGRNVLPELGHMTAEHISSDDCRAYIAKRRAAGRMDGTIRTELGCLRSALIWAQRQQLINRGPRIEMPQTPPPRERYLSRREVSALIEAAIEPHIRLAILLMLTTAGRSGALFELTWNRVDLERRVIKLSSSDIGPRKGRATVPINDTLVAALQTARQAALSDYVIEWGGRRVRSIKTGFNAAVLRAGIAHCTPHDLRRTAGRFMAEAGVPIEEIAQYLGHTNPNVTRSTYSKFSPEYLRKAASALEF
ncbi:tyrosine-type recombinase/integrase [Yoonia vestfoldensis]|nr:tyrosine-type recombinase/integrase [Yoonia vestfoldensis]